ncbi:hypothetical protein JX265_000567 [Neoarthrinium moseri]|uniref:Thioesterase domain-containing protein n=1 Tax=Neoarthrinium moseri TaxID=1658444 RepID=A0A9P9WYS3_9PEZI|nr:hypothetical protein JX265_000567 [Neoarthrinium moseri]
MRGAMFRPQRQLSRLVAAGPSPSRLSSLAGPRCCCCSGSFARRASPPRPLTTRAFATAPALQDKQPVGAHDAPEAATEAPSAPQPQLPPSKTPKRRRRGVVAALVFLFVGTGIGSLFRLSVSPPPLPAPGTREDELLLPSIHDKAAKLPIVQLLSSDPSWESWSAYESRSERSPSITSGPMSGSRGLAYQRIFYKQETGEMTSVIYFGGALSGFPGVVHGGALATVLDETLGRCAIVRFPARTGVTATLDLTYRKPTLTNAFYVIKTRPVVLEADEVVGNDGTKKSDRKLWVEGNIQTLDGKVCVEAKALFVVPKGVKPGPISGKW